MDLEFEKNREKLLAQINQMRSKTKEDKKPAHQLLLFGEQSPFLDTLSDTLSKDYTLQSFNDAEKAIAWCVDHSINKVILDFDPPTDWKMATDVFTTVRTINPKVNFILLTKSPQSTPVQTLAAQKATVLVKPFKSEALYSKLTEGN